MLKGRSHKTRGTWFCRAISENLSRCRSSFDAWPFCVNLRHRSIVSPPIFTTQQHCFFSHQTWLKSQLSLRCTCSGSPRHVWGPNAAVVSGYMISFGGAQSSVCSTISYRSSIWTMAASSSTSGWLLVSLRTCLWCNVCIVIQCNVL